MDSRQTSQIHSTNQVNFSSHYDSTLASIGFNEMEKVCNVSEAVPKYISMKKSGALLKPNANRVQTSKLLQSIQFQHAMPPPPVPAKQTVTLGGASKENKRASHRIVNISARSSIRRQDNVLKPLSRREPERVVNVTVRSPIRSQVSDVLDNQKVAIALDDITVATRKPCSRGHKRARNVTSQACEVVGRSTKRRKLTPGSAIVKQGSVSHKQSDISDGSGDTGHLAAVVNGSVPEANTNFPITRTVTSQVRVVGGRSPNRMNMTTRASIVKQESVPEHKTDGSDGFRDPRNFADSVNGTMPEANINSSRAIAFCVSKATSGVTLRSYSSCQLELPNRVEEKIKDPLMGTEYASDIFEYFRSLEDKFPVQKDYLEGQAVSPKMRMILVDWIAEVHDGFRMLPETLYLSIAIVDRYMQVNRKVTAEYFQLVGITALLVAGKYEETRIPALQDFLYICPDIYSRRNILTMEWDILKQLNFNLGRPLALQFLSWYNKLAAVRPIHNALGKYILELALMRYELCQVSPSLQAAAACCLSVGIINEFEELSTAWTPRFVHLMGYEYYQLKEVVTILAELLVESESCRLQTIRTKYSLSKYWEISTCPLLQGSLVKKLIQEKTKKYRKLIFLVILEII